MVDTIASDTEKQSFPRARFQYNLPIFSSHFVEGAQLQIPKKKISDKLTPTHPHRKTNVLLQERNK